MKTTKKLLILCLIAVMAVVAVMPSTFSWYAHSGEVRYKGNTIRYFDSSGLEDNASVSQINEATRPVTLPLSLKQQSGDTATVTMNTYESDAYGKITNNTELTTFGVSCVSAAENGIPNTKHYVTKFINTGSEDVYIDFEMTGFSNNTNAFLGVKAPVVTEKNFALRAETHPITNNDIRIYFEHRDKFGWWNTLYDEDSPNYYDATEEDKESASDGWCDMNIQYDSMSQNTDIQTYMLNAPETDDGDDNKEYAVCYWDIDASATYLFFFNNYYLWTGSYKPNQTPNYTPAKHTVYYLDGTVDSGNDKDKRFCHSYSSFDLLSVNSYYDKVTMAEGSTAFIGLVRGTDDSDTNYDYTGKDTIKYEVVGEGSAYVSVSKEGLVTAKSRSAGHTAQIKTTVWGRYGDSKELFTTVNIPQQISQVPIVQNLKIPADNADSPVEVHWYVKNTGESPIGFTNVFYTL